MSILKEKCVWMFFPFFVHLSVWGFCAVLFLLSAVGIIRFAHLQI